MDAKQPKQQTAPSSGVELAQHIMQFVSTLESAPTRSRQTDELMRQLRGVIPLLTAYDANAAESGHSLGLLVRRRRGQAELSLEELAKRAGLCKNTIHNLEHGAHVPTPETLRRLFNVSELGLSPVDLQPPAPPDWSPNSWVSHDYDPVKMIAELQRLINGPGGSIEQTYLYLDNQSAADWLTICSTESFSDSFRKTRPLQEVAAQINQLTRGFPLDINALGPGDGKSEIALVSHLLDEAPAPGMRFQLLDISHSLLVASLTLAAQTFAGRSLYLMSLHADFHKLSMSEPMHAGAEATTRRRVYTLIGYTLPNLENEVKFFESLSACAAPGDVCVVDIQTAYAASDDPDEIRAKDPAFSNVPPPNYLKFGTGPLWRYGRGIRDIRCHFELGTECLIPGSYEINLVAKVEMLSGQEKRFVLGRFKRYDPKRLGESLRARGWIPEWSKMYGGPSGKAAAVMVLRRGTQ